MTLTLNRRQQAKYKSFMTCSVKGCTAPPFADPKEFKKHRQESHGFQKHDHSHKIPCPERTCGRRKQSRGFVSQTALDEHMRRYHGTDPPTTNGAEAGSPDDDLAAALSAEVGDATLDQDEAEDDDSPDAEGPLSGPARRHMEGRLAQLEKERSRLDDEIERIRQTLYGQVEPPIDEMQVAADVDFADVPSIP